MADIFHQLVIEADLATVFAAVSTPEGLDRWWTDTCSGERRVGEEYRLGFGPEYPWAGVVCRLEENHRFELEITEASEDWIGTRVGFRLVEQPGGSTELRFHHIGWPEVSDHFRRSSYCWAMYLRLLKRGIETGEIVSYSDRPNA